MPGPLRFKAHLVVEQVPAQGLFILSERGEHVFRERIFVRIAEAIDGERDETTIVRVLADEFSPALLFYAIARLRRAGFVDDQPPAAPPGESAHWDALGIPPSAAAKHGNDVLALVTIGELDPDPYRAQLEALGLTLDEHASHALVLTDDYLRPALDRFEREARAAGRRLMLAKPGGLEPWLGPVLDPQRPGCWACLAHRLAGHRRVQRFLQIQTDRREPFITARAELPAMRGAVLGLLVAQVQRWLAAPEASHPLVEGVISLDADTLATRRHALVARPQCPRCGDPTLMRRQMMHAPALLERPASVRDGGRRSVDPAATYARLEHHVSPITGLISAVHRATPATNHSAHAFYTDHNFVHMTDNLEFLRISLRSHSGGKGRSELQAKTGALCESLERYSSVIQGDEALIEASFSALVERGEAVVDPREMMQFSARQYAERERWNRSGELFCWVPEPFDEHATIEWTPAWTLAGERRLVASALCFYAAGSAMMRADSNGCAAGNNLEEAVLQGLMELVERDAIGLWWYNRLRLPGVDLASFGDPWFEEALAEAREHGRELWALALPSDLGVPCYAAVSRRIVASEGEPHEVPIFGFGAHLDPRLALARALTEHEQLSQHASIGPEGPPADTITGRWYRSASLATEPYLAPDPNQPVHRCPERPAALAGASLLGEIHHCEGKLGERGLELLIQDHTRPDTQLSVVKVIVPGLRHFWARFGPGRLYEVPVELGLRERPCEEHELNPVPLFV